MKKIYLIMICVIWGISLLGCNVTEGIDIVEESTDTLAESVEDTIQDTENISVDEEYSEVAISGIEGANPKHVIIDFSLVNEKYAEGTEVKPYELKMVDEGKIDVMNADEWYIQKNLSLPMLGNEWNHFSDEEYEYRWVGSALEIYEKETDNCLYSIEYPTDKWYVNGNNAYLKDGIFYGGCIANGYAQPNSCFLFAYDLDKEEILWRSADQTYNTMNFVVKEDIIICGYGFTDENDYLYQINRNTGEVIEQMELKKMPDLIVEQDGKLYVHTYSYDYTIEFE